MLKGIFRKLTFLLALVTIAGFGIREVLNHPRFGRLPQGQRLERIRQSPNYKAEEFHYPLPSPLPPRKGGMFSILWKNLTQRNDRLIPDHKLPVRKTDLKTLDPKQNLAVWLGHSSWFVQAGGKKFLLDPVLSDYAAPFSFLVRAFDGTSLYAAEDLPEIDCLLITHDHWDHLDHSTVMALKSKIGQVICPLGLGEYFDYWGFPAEMVNESDWNDRIDLGKGISVTLLPSRHWSRRMFTRNKIFWTAFALESPGLKLFFSGDSGYGPHFRETGEKFKGFDMVFLDCGQYDARWPYSHMKPEETAMAAEDLGAKVLLPSHVGRFAIANHGWDEPFIRLTQASKGKSRLLTPMIGEIVRPHDDPSGFSKWWEVNVKEGGDF